MYNQIKLPHDKNGSMEDGRAPARWHTLAYGYEGNSYIEYLIVDTDTGMSDESGELLTKYFVRRTEEYRPDAKGYDIWSRHESDLTLYVNEQGDAYRSWKGKLNGRPVCNFETGFIYRYKRPKKESK